MSLILHAGAESIDYEALCRLSTPEPTETHRPIPHGFLIDLVRDRLAGYGHEITKEQYGVTPDNMRMFGVITLKSSTPQGDYTDMVGLRNSHNKKLPVGIAYGSCVFVCDNLAFAGDNVIRRKHTSGILRDLPRLLDEVIEPLALQREQQAQKIDTYKTTYLTDERADHAILDLYRQDVINVQRIAEVVKQWEEPACDWGDRTAWRLFNAATWALKDSSSVVEKPAITQRLHRVIDGVCAAA